MVVDSNLLVYASLTDHPAGDPARSYLSLGAAWLTSAAALVEMARVLTGVYGADPDFVERTLTGLSQAMSVEPLTADVLLDASPLQRRHGIDQTDAILLVTCLSRQAELATDDRGLARAASASGIRVEDPIGPEVRSTIARWEADHLPPKGLPRVLAQIHRWIDLRSPELASEFRSATQDLSRIV